MIWARERKSASSSTTRIADMGIDLCETEARRNRREIIWLESSDTTRCRKVLVPLSLVGPRNRNVVAPLVGLHDGGFGVNLESLTVWQIVARAVVIYLAGVLLVRVGD